MDNRHWAYQTVPRCFKDAAASLFGWRRGRRSENRIHTLARNFTTLLEDDFCAVYLDDRPGENCLIAFTGIGHGTGGIDLQRPEFVKAGVVGPRLFIIDRTRSWGNHLDLDVIVEAVLPYSRGRRVVTIGNSMGGFLAILCSEALAATRTLAFSPQWSVDPFCVPDEPRWMEYRSKITNIRFPDLSTAFVSDCRYDIVFGDDQMERAHAEKFPVEQENVALYRIHGTDHDVAAALKTRGCLHDVVSVSLTGGQMPMVLKKAGIRFEAFGAGAVHNR